MKLTTTTSSGGLEDDIQFASNVLNRLDLAAMDVMKVEKKHRCEIRLLSSSKKEEKDLRSMTGLELWVTIHHKISSCTVKVTFVYNRDDERCVMHSIPSVVVEGKEEQRWEAVRQY